MIIDQNELDVRFTYHSPRDDQPRKYTMLREQAKELAEGMVMDCPQSRELSLALTHLEQAVMWANAAIARRS
jgi:hypothetical protein